MRLLQDLSNQKPQTPNTPNLQLLLSSSCLYSLMCSLPRHLFPMQWLVEARYRAPYSGLEHTEQANLVSGGNNQCGLMLLQRLSAAAGGGLGRTTLLFCQLAEKPCFNKGGRAEFHLAQRRSCDPTLAVTCLCCASEPRCGQPATRACPWSIWPQRFW